MKNAVFSILCIICFFYSKAQNPEKPIYVNVYGKGDPILIIPGFTVPGDAWLPIVKELEQKYQCHVLTLAGFGGKQPISFPWLPQVNKAIEQYIKDKKLKNITVIGHSLGGTLATWLASRGNNISKIVLIDALPAAGALMIPNFNSNDLTYDSPYTKQQLEMNAQQFEMMAGMFAKGMSTESNNQELIKKWIIESDRKTYVFGYIDYLKLDVRENLKKINIPVFIIAADQPQGKEITEQNFKMQYQNLKSYDLQIVEKSAHFLMMDRHEWFIGHLNKILTKKND